MPKRYQNKDYKMITKLLRKFCSNEVQMMLKHLEEHPEDFDGDIYPCTWYNLLGDVSRQGTFIEQVVTRNMKHKVFKKLRRDKYLQSIVKQTIDPEKPEPISPGSIVYAGVGGISNGQMQQLQQTRLAQIYQAQQALNTQQAQP
jgi:hypothetical protein